jgi:hypothetical protein
MIGLGGGQSAMHIRAKMSELTSEIELALSFPAVALISGTRKRRERAGVARAASISRRESKSQNMAV